MDKNVSRQRLLLGTHAGSTDEPNYLVIAEIVLPMKDSSLLIKEPEEVESKSEAASLPTANFGKVRGKLNPIQQIIHDGKAVRHLR